MIEALGFEFMRNALLAGLLASVACGIIGALVIVNRMAFLAGGISHAAYGGVGLAMYLGYPVLPCVIGFSLASSTAMAVATNRALHRSDAVIGAMWAAGMAFGIILADLTPGYNADLMSYLFGSILAVPGSDLLLMAGLDALILALVLALYRGLSASAYDRDYARTRGVPVSALHYLLLGLVALAVVMVIRVVGLILVIALLTIPASIMHTRASSLGGMMLGASALSALFCVAGLGMSYGLNITSGAAIIAVATVAFGLDLALDGRGRR